MMEIINKLHDLIETYKEAGKTALENLVERIDQNMDDRLDVWDDDEL